MEVQVLQRGDAVLQHERYKAEESIKSTVTSDLGKSCEVCFGAGLSIKVLKPGDGAGESS